MPEKNNQPKKKKMTINQLIYALNNEHKLTELNKIAIDNKQVYQAHIDAGFTPQQSMQILLLLINMGGNN